jgi:4'-phosphopantetheinyl transferase
MVAHPAASVRLWLVQRQQVAPNLAILSADEVARAERYRVEGPRQQFLAARTLLRRAIAAWLGSPPKNLTFVYNAYGKPSLADAPTVAFSLAHSGDWLALAVSDAGPVGLDLEQKRPLALTSLSSYLAPPESAHIMGAPAGAKQDLFFRYWVLKESYLKATGRGFSLPLTSFAFSPTDPPRLIFSSLNDAETWQFCLPAAPDGYALALALPAPIKIEIGRGQYPPA